MEKPIELARKAADVLEERGIENARLEAELLLADVLGIRRLDLYLQYDRPLTPDEVASYRTAVRRRLRHEPVQYIVGEVQFRELTLRVDRRVLIPRPETEILVGAVLDWAAERGDALDAIDIGTGSGAIALSLLYEGPFDRVVATDASEDALEAASENAERLGLAERIEPRVGSTWEPVAQDERFDVVVSNPPYVSEAERGTLPPEVRDWEPSAALFAPDRGLQILDAIVAGAPRHLRAGGLLALEVGLGQAAEVVERIEANGGYDNARVMRDLADRERVVLATTKTNDHSEGTDGDG